MSYELLIVLIIKNSNNCEKFKIPMINEKEYEKMIQTCLRCSIGE